MTKEEVKEYLKFYWYEFDLDEYVELEILTAMNKAIKQEVLKQDKNFICPHCESFVNFSNKYCKECGQALDWSKIYVSIKEKKEYKNE